MPHITVPQHPTFPNGLPCAPIQRIPLSGLLCSDPSALADLSSACRTHGFFYLDCNTCSEGQALVDMANELEHLSHSAFRTLSQETKDAADMAVHNRSLFGYKRPGCVAAHDPHRRRDVGEFWNLSKDDILGQSDQPVPYPDMFLGQATTTATRGTANAGQQQQQDSKPQPLLETYVRAAHSICLSILRLLASDLSIPVDSLTSRHRLSEPSGDHVRLTFGPGDPDAADIVVSSPPNPSSPSTEQEEEAEKNTKITTYAHTDFGSVTLLFNWLGGLQIEKTGAGTGKGTGKWEWVRPLPGHCICNLGDAMVEFSGGKLKSGKHRVVAAPGREQGKEDRYSVVYFCRPEDEVWLEDLTNPSISAEEGKGEGERGEGEKKRWKAGRWIDEKARGMGNVIPVKGK